MSEADIILNGKREDINGLIRSTLNDHKFRQHLALGEDVWEALRQRVLYDDDISVYKLINNLSACQETAVMETEFLEILTTVKTPNSRYVYQILANFSASLGQYEEFQTIITEWNEWLEDDEVPEECIFPAILLCVNSQVIKCDNLVIKVFDAVLGAAPKWIDDDKKAREMKVIISFIRLIFEKDEIYSFIMHCKDNEEQLLTLLKLVDGCYSTGHVYWTTHEGQMAVCGLSQSLQKYASILTDMIRSGQRTPNVITTWNLVCVLLDLSSTFLKEPSGKIVRYYRAILKELIQLLIAARDLPQKNKMNEIDSQTVDVEDLPYLRSKTLSVLGYIVKGDRASQDMVRNTKGLTAILECCVIDGNNPLMKEHAIVCIRYLLENNLENQRFVEVLEAKKVVNPDVLAESGYEVEIKNGKVTLKH